MYSPNHFRVDDLDKLQSLMMANSFATLITHDGAAPFATHLPFHVDAGRGPYGTLRAHLARANGQWKHFGDAEVLVIFQGPHAYISPSWYASAPMVPTWNYAAVHAYGRARIVDDAGLQEILELTVAQYESQPSRLEVLRERSARSSTSPPPPSRLPWQMSSLPIDYVDKLRRAIVGFEIEITRLEGKFKMSQNQTVADQAGAVAGLREAGDPLSIAVAEMMEAIRD